MKVKQSIKRHKKRRKEIQGKKRTMKPSREKNALIDMEKVLHRMKAVSILNAGSGFTSHTRERELTGRSPRNTKKGSPAVQAGRTYSENATVCKRSFLLQELLRQPLAEAA